jgi:hypothetical protein
VPDLNVKQQLLQEPKTSQRYKIIALRQMSLKRLPYRGAVQIVQFFWQKKSIIDDNLALVIKPVRHLKLECEFALTALSLQSHLGNAKLAIFWIMSWAYCQHLADSITQSWKDQSLSHLVTAARLEKLTLGQLPLNELLFVPTAVLHHSQCQLIHRARLLILNKERCNLFQV